MNLDYLKPENYLSKEEEKEILILCKQGNPTAIKRLIFSNIKYIYSQASKMTKDAEQIDELIMQGIIGIINAINHFDIDRKVRFITFASFWIRKEMLDYFYENCSYFHLSSAKVRLATKIKKLFSKFAYLNNQNLIIQKICESISCSENEVIELLNISSTNVSLDSPAKKENNTPVIEFIEDKNICLEEDFIQKSEIECLKNALDELSNIEKDVLIRHYGLFNHTIQSFDEIAKHQCKSKARIHQIEKQAKLKLKKII